MSDERISEMTQGTPNLGSLIETSQPDGSGGWLTRKLTLGQAMLTGSLYSRWVAGYGFQYYDNSPAFSSQPWRTSYLYAGTMSLDGGVPTIAPQFPVMVSAVHSGSNNVLTFSWTDTTYGGTGFLEIWKNGVQLTTTGSSATTYTDDGGTGVTYQVRWNNGTFATLLSNAVVSA